MLEVFAVSGITQHRLVVTVVSGQYIHPVFNCQAVKDEVMAAVRTPEV
jgi:hypothetical protein